MTRFRYHTASKQLVTARAKKKEPTLTQLRNTVKNAIRRRDILRKNYVWGLVTPLKYKKEKASLNTLIRNLQTQVQEREFFNAVFPY